MSKASRLLPNMSVDQKDRLADFFGCTPDLFDSTVQSERYSARVACLGDSWLSLVLIQTLDSTEDISKVRSFYASNLILGWFMRKILGQGAHFNDHTLGDLFEACLYITSHPQVADGAVEPFDVECTPDGYDRSVRCVLALKRWSFMAGCGKGDDGLVLSPHTGISIDALRAGVLPIKFGEISGMRSTLVRICTQQQRDVQLQRAVERVTALDLTGYSSVLDLADRDEREASLALLQKQQRSVTRSVLREIPIALGGEGQDSKNYNNNNFDHHHRNIDDDDDSGSQLNGTDSRERRQQDAHSSFGGVDAAAANGDSSSSNADMASARQRGHDKQHLELAQAEHSREIHHWRTPTEIGWTDQHPVCRCPLPGQMFRPHCRSAMRVMWETRVSKRHVTPLFHPCCGAPEGLPCSCRVGAESMRHTGAVRLTRESKHHYSKGASEISAVWTCCGRPLVKAEPAPLCFSIVPESENGCTASQDAMSLARPPPSIPDKEVYPGVLDDSMRPVTATGTASSHRSNNNDDDDDPPIDKFYGREKENCGSKYVHRPMKNMQRHVPGKTKISAPLFRERRRMSGAVVVGKSDVDGEAEQQQQQQNVRSRRREGLLQRHRAAALAQGRTWTEEDQAAFDAEETSGDEEDLFDYIVLHHPVDKGPFRPLSATPLPSAAAGGGGRESMASAAGQRRERSPAQQQQPQKQIPARAPRPPPDYSNQLHHPPQQQQQTTQRQPQQQQHQMHAHHHHHHHQHQQYPGQQQLTNSHQIGPHGQQHYYHLDQQHHHHQDHHHHHHHHHHHTHHMQMPSHPVQWGGQVVYLQNQQLPPPPQHHQPLSQHHHQPPPQHHDHQRPPQHQHQPPPQHHDHQRPPQHHHHHHPYLGGQSNYRSGSGQGFGAYHGSYNGQHNNHH